MAQFRETKASRLKNCIFLCFFISLFATADTGDYKTHTVKTGESLSEILYSYNFKPIYPKDGSLQNTILTNQVLSKGTGDLIFPGQVINLYRASSSSHREVSIKSESHKSEDDNTSHGSTFNTSNKDNNNTLSVSLLSGYFGVLGKNNGSSKGEILSKIYFGVGGKWRTQLTKNYLFELALDYSKIEIADSASTALTSRDQDLKRIGVSVSRSFPWLNLTGGYNLLDQIFYRSVGSNNFKVFSMLNHQIYLNAQKSLYNYGNSVVSIGINTSLNKFNVPSGIDVSSGFGYGSYLKIEKQRSDQNLAAILSYERRTFKSSNTTVNFKSLVLRFDYEFDFLEGDNI